MIKKNLYTLYEEHNGKVSDKWLSYLHEYERAFADFRLAPIKLLEIGVQNGGSLEIWGKYFDNAKALVGCDINPTCAILTYDNPIISIVVGDANTDPTENSISQLSPEFDIVIDDGSHRSSDIVKSFARYFPKIVNGGLFIAEDLHCSYWQEFEGGLFDPFSSINFFKRLADILHHEHWGIAVDRTSILKGFFSKYDVHIDDEVLRHVHSIEFVNSMCIVKKAAPPGNDLSYRFIAGVSEAVVAGHLSLLTTNSVALDQSSNQWSSRRIPPDEELPFVVKALIELEHQNSDLNTALTTKVQIIDELNQVVAVQNQQADNLNEQLTALTDLTRQKSEQVTLLENEIAAIRASRTWKILQKIARIKQIFFPR